MALDDYGGAIASARNAAPDYATMRAQEQLRAIQGGQLKLQMQQAQQQLEGERAYKDDLTKYLAGPTPQGAAEMMQRHPDRAAPFKQAFDAMKDDKKTAEVQHIGEIYSSAKNGRYDLAAGIMERRIAADEAAGDTDTEFDKQILSGLKSENPAERTAALGMIEYTLQIATDGKLGGKEKGGYTLDAGATRYDESGQIVAQSPFFKGPDGRMAERISEGGDPASGQSGSGSPTGPARTDLPAPQAAVASVLAQGLPGHVVSGFLGNFEVEGGYGGAKGDGGSAHGIAQWRGERQANFQRVIGKSPADASHAEQARFVMWEMENPEKAGMTVGQRDQIMAARSPQEAAVLIDEFYERSSGQHRDRRVAAATRYHGSGGAAASAMSDGDDPAPKGYRWITPPKQKEAPSGYRYTGDGNLSAIPGGPADKPAEGKDPPSGYRWAANGKSLEAIPGGPGMKARTQLPKVPAATMAGYISNTKSIRSIDTTLAHLKKHPNAVGKWNLVTPDAWAQTIDPKGVDARAGVSDVGSLIVHERSGANVTVGETPRLLPFIPSSNDDPATVVKKMSRLRAELVSMNADMADAYSNEDGESQLHKIGLIPSGLNRIRSS